METHNSQKSEARWFALVNDRIVIMPRKVVEVTLLRTLAQVPQDQALVRDYSSPFDVSLPDNGSVDLSEGNVFVLRPRTAENVSIHPPEVSPKLALAVDDKFEIVQITELPIEALKSLFTLPPDVELLRDFESPQDEIIPSGATVRFLDGPTFITRTGAPKHIDVAVTTTSGFFPQEGFERLPIDQPVKHQLARAAQFLHLTNTTNWIAKIGDTKIDVEKSYAGNGLSGQVNISYGPAHGGGGAL
jgi:hypothetical protein